MKNGVRIRRRNDGQGRVGSNNVIKLVVVDVEWLVGQGLLSDSRPDKYLCSSQCCVCHSSLEGGRICTVESLASVGGGTKSKTLNVFWLIIWAVAGTFCAKTPQEKVSRAVPANNPAARTATVDGMVKSEQAKIVWNVRNWSVGLFGETGQRKALILVKRGFAHYPLVYIHQDHHQNSRGGRWNRRQPYRSLAISIHTKKKHYTSSESDLLWRPV
jgi:hypothetical protein